MYQAEMFQCCPLFISSVHPLDVFFTSLKAKILYTFNWMFIRIPWQTSIQVYMYSIFCSATNPSPKKVIVQSRVKYLQWLESYFISYLDCLSSLQLGLGI